MKTEQTQCSETSAYKIHTPGNYPEKKHTTYRTRRKFEIKNRCKNFSLLQNLQNCLESTKPAWSPPNLPGVHQTCLESTKPPS